MMAGESVDAGGPEEEKTGRQRQSHDEVREGVCDGEERLRVRLSGLYTSTVFPRYSVTPRPLVTFSPISTHKDPLRLRLGTVHCGSPAERLAHQSRKAYPRSDQSHSISPSGLLKSVTSDGSYTVDNQGH